MSWFKTFFSTLFFPFHPLSVSISSRIYSLSKAAVWRTFFFAAASESRLTSAGSRILLSDTDSIIHATERPISRYERWLHRSLYSDSNNPVLFSRSEIAKDLTSETFRTWHRILDYSSISTESTLFRSHFADSPAYAAMFKYMALVTRKSLLRWQDETGGLDLLHFNSPSAKSYCLDAVSETATLPIVEPTILPFPAFPPSDPVNRFSCTRNFVRKSKGVRRAVLQREASLKDFVEATKTEQLPRSVGEYSIRRKNFRLFLISQRKRLLSRCLIKRLTYPSMRRPEYHFTLPLHCKRLV